MAEPTVYPKTASCICGGLAVTVTAPPQMVHACSCLDCQRSTGSAFSYSGFFAEDAVTVSGEVRSYRRTTDAGRWQEMDFCPVCGGCVFYRLQVLPKIIGVSIGCFADPGFGKPEKLFWASRRPHWFDVPAAVEAVETQ